MNGAAQESNLPSDGLRRLTGFEALSEKADLQGISPWCASRCASKQVHGHERRPWLRLMNLISWGSVAVGPRFIRSSAQGLSQEAEALAST